jgi:hypothetical protein
MRSLDFSIYPSPPNCNMAMGFTQPLTEMNTRNLPGDKKAAGMSGWQTHCHLWADCLENVGFTTYHNLTGLNSLLEGYFYFFFRKFRILWMKFYLLVEKQCSHISGPSTLEANLCVVGLWKPPESDSKYPVDLLNKGHSREKARKTANPELFVPVIRAYH